jgi:chromosome partitioning protein
MNSYVIAVCQQKGGVAKTTTVSALGAALAEKGRRVLLIDLDPSGNLTSGLGFNLVQQRKSAADILLGNETVERVAQPLTYAGLTLIPSNGEMATVAHFLNVRPNYEALLRQHLANNAANAFDYILLDCPPTLGSVATAALVAADLAILPVQCEYFAIQALSSMFKFIHAIRARHNPRLHYRLLVTMFDMRGNLHAQVLEKLQANYPGALLQTKIGFDSKLRASQVAGVPINLYDSNTRAAQQYRELADEIIAYVEP